MSNSNAPPGFGGTLTNGIQDIAGLLPIIGIEKCEEHIGSALQGGYLYAAATPLSIFGSLGIIKAGVSILVASVSTPKLTRSGRWLGARVLDNAGFKLPGTVAPLIGMDKRRYKAESRLIDMLEAKHIDKPEKLSIEWKSMEWNLGLLVFTMLTAAFGFTPYIKLTILEHSSVNSSWIFPLLRILGSCIASVCCQILIQHRVISLMKNRIIFMVINRLHSDELDKLDKLAAFSAQTEPRDTLPAEEYLEQLEHLRVHVPRQITPSTDCEADDVEKQLHQQDAAEIKRGDTPLKAEHPKISLSLCKTLDEQRKKHFSLSSIDSEPLVFFISWILLLLSLPAAIAGYIGCFTVVSRSEDSKDPLIWLGIEAALSVIRVLLWALDPKFDEKTDVAVTLTLAEHEPFVTTEKDVDALSKNDKVLPLMPERRFLEWITPYTGPLEQFKTVENIALYFTLTGGLEDRQKHLFMTVLDLHKRMAFTLRPSVKPPQLAYVAASVNCDAVSVEMQAELQSDITSDHPWRRNHSRLFDSLSTYYYTLLCQLKQADPGRPGHQMSLQWNLEEKTSDTQKKISNPPHSPESIPLTEQDQISYLQRGHEHQLKSMLVDNWGTWIVHGMAAIRTEARNSCLYHLANPSSIEAEWELTELDTQLVWEWLKREQNLLHLSVKLEDNLRRKMDSVRKRQDKQLEEWIGSEFNVGQRKRLEKEWKQAKARMERASAECIKQQKKDDWNVEEKWKIAKAFINREWESSIAGGSPSLASLEDLVNKHQPKSWRLRDDGQRRLAFLNLLKSRFSPWDSQRNSERREMEYTVEKVAGETDDEKLESTYKYPESSTELATTIHSRFPYLGSLSPTDGLFAVKHSAGMVYATHFCSPEIVRAVIEKNSCRCVRLVPPELIESDPISENDHLLYLSQRLGSNNEREVDLPFIQRNRNRWWQQQKENSFIFYFSPGYSRMGQQYIATYSGRIAHIMIYIKTRTCVRLRLLHCQDRDVSVSIKMQGGEHPLHNIPADDIPEHPQSKLHDIQLGEFQPGQYELDVVVARKPGSDSGSYLLRDVLIDFHNDAPLIFSTDGRNRHKSEEVGPSSTEGAEKQTLVETLN